MEIYLFGGTCVVKGTQPQRFLGMKYPTMELFRDVGLLLLVFANWTLTCSLVDSVTDSTVARQAFAVYIAAFSCATNAFSLWRSWGYLGACDAPPETLLGLFAEICNLTQAWGALFAATRYFVLSDDDPFFEYSFIRAQFESIFEMSLVQAGVGWTSTVPTTVIEKIVAWLAMFVGGVLCTNMFLLSVVLSQRGYWQCSTRSAEAAAAVHMPPLAMRVERLYH